MDALLNLLCQSVEDEGLRVDLEKQKLEMIVRIHQALYEMEHQNVRTLGSRSATVNE